MLSHIPQNPLVWNGNRNGTLKQLLIYFIIVVPLLPDLEPLAKIKTDFDINLQRFMGYQSKVHMVVCMYFYYRYLGKIVGTIEAQNPMISSHDLMIKLLDVFNMNCAPGHIHTSIFVWRLLMIVILSVDYNTNPIVGCFEIGFYMLTPYKSYMVSYRDSYLLSNAVGLHMGSKILKQAISYVGVE